VEAPRVGATLQPTGSLFSAVTDIKPFVFFLTMISSLFLPDHLGRKFSDLKLGSFLFFFIAVYARTF
jgi:hypothetical protein